MESLIAYFSRDVRSGVATEAIKQGIPAIAFSGAGGTQHSFTEPDPVADLYAQVALKVIQAVTASKPFLPGGTALVRFTSSLLLHPVLESNIHYQMCAERQLPLLGRDDLHKTLRLHLHPLPCKLRLQPVHSRRQSLRDEAPPH